MKTPKIPTPNPLFLYITAAFLTTATAAFASAVGAGFLAASGAAYLAILAFNV